MPSIIALDELIPLRRVSLTRYWLILVMISLILFELFLVKPQWDLMINLDSLLEARAYALVRSLPPISGWKSWLELLPTWFMVNTSVVAAALGMTQGDPRGHRLRGPLRSAHSYVSCTAPCLFKNWTKLIFNLINGNCYENLFVKHDCLHLCLHLSRNRSLLSAEYLYKLGIWQRHWLWISHPSLLTLS